MPRVRIFPICAQTTTTTPLFCPCPTSRSVASLFHASAPCSLFFTPHVNTKTFFSCTSLMDREIMLCAHEGKKAPSVALLLLHYDTVALKSPSLTLSCRTLQTVIHASIALSHKNSRGKQRDATMHKSLLLFHTERRRPSS